MKNNRRALFGVPLRKLRNDMNLTQWGLADRCSIDPSYISLLENNIKSPKLSTVFIIADGLGIKASELVKAIEEYM
ncbi:helix-turn-helix transcriptional regulator [Bacillus sp. ISL-18]|uniref:helix-turn-helix domain-containing protein n=1 Tax=Bacillus sp. ISL-18 TaxID=2819118 RepID=UPI001BE7F2C0|nr:helix-turn-helix transcriptional regulator [Bacillus sp. ISL-18]MBT2658615.1 helix-turn-helix transcriptional regulator [Bacillus sp. ISL-18]